MSLKIRKGISFRELVFKDLQKFQYQEKLDRSLAANILIEIGILTLEKMNWSERANLIQTMIRTFS